MSPPTAATTVTMTLMGALRVRSMIIEQANKNAEHHCNGLGPAVPVTTRATDDAAHGTRRHDEEREEPGGLVWFASPLP